jgi:hypothetical protein
MAENLFWMNVCRLGDDYDDLGLTTQERVSRALEEFRELPPNARQEALKALGELAITLPDLYTAAAGESRRTRSPRMRLQHAK